MRSRTLVWTRRLVAAAMLAALAWVLVAGRGEGLALAANLGIRFAGAASVGLFGLLFGAASWSTLIGSSLRGGISTFGITLPLKNLPLGGLGQMVGMSGLSVASGTAASRVVQATPLFVLATAAGASTVALPIIWADGVPLWIKGLVAAVALGILAVLLVGGNVALRFEERFPSLVHWNRRQLLLAVGFSTLSMVGAGSAFAILFPFGNSFFDTVVRFAASWLSGFLFVVAPAGLGVREAVLTTLWPGLDAATVVATSVVHRFSTLSGELVLFFVGWWYSRDWRATGEVQERSHVDQRAEERVKPIEGERSHGGRKSPETVRVCWAGSFDPGFGRNRRLRHHLEAASIEWTVVRVGIWPADRLDAFSKGRVRAGVRMLVLYPWLLLRLLLARRPDVYLVSYPGWVDVPVVKLVAMLKRRPLVFDVFISLYDTAVSDRQLVGPKTMTAQLARAADRLSLRLSDRVLADCPAHARFLGCFAGVERERFGLVYVGADDAIFHPDPSADVDESLILFYGSYIPLHGVEHIVRAAAALSGSGIKFRMIGGGQTHGEVMALTARLGIRNVEFVERVPETELADEIRGAALCLGIFGTSDKADRVIPHKVFEALACQRPVLTAASQAVRETFSEDEVALCPPGDAEALANSIADLMADPARRQRIAIAGRARYEREFSDEALGRQFVCELLKVAKHVG